MPTASLTHCLSRLGLVDPQCWCDQATRMEFAAGETLLPQGARQRYGFFIESGIARACHYDPAGQARCKEFYFEGELCLLYDYWLGQTPSDYALEAVEALRVRRLPLAWLDLPEWAQVQRRLLRQQLRYKEQKEAFLLLHDAEQRYLVLRERFPEWEARLTQVQLAGYIGISPVSLSRIRRRINPG
ncbi:Crp/Fnr family transcriptional regulator [Aeromonas diversa]|uniref:Crp/Fnr family transcriptional regulator n=1 Tax=Aeromonas diversa TaxID=502790 RepID=UPI0039A24AD5